MTPSLFLAGGAASLWQDDQGADTETTEGAVAAVEDHSGGEDHSTPLLEDSNTWVLVGFILVVGLFLWQNVPGIFGKMLGARADKVREQLDEARTLREDAQRLLADFQKRQREAEAEAAGIIEQAKRDAKLMSTEARQKLDEQLARRRAAAEERISRAEEQAVAAVRAQAAELSVAAAQEIIAGRMDAKSQGQLIDKAIADVRGQLN